MKRAVAGTCPHNSDELLTGLLPDAQKTTLPHVCYRVIYSLHATQACPKPHKPVSACEAVTSI